MVAGILSALAPLLAGQSTPDVGAGRRLPSMIRPGGTVIQPPVPLAPAALPGGGGGLLSGLANAAAQPSSGGGGIGGALQDISGAFAARGASGGGPLSFLLGIPAQVAGASQRRDIVSQLKAAYQTAIARGLHPADAAIEVLKSPIGGEVFQSPELMATLKDLVSFGPEAGETNFQQIRFPDTGEIKLVDMGDPAVRAEVAGRGGQLTGEIDQPQVARSPERFEQDALLAQLGRQPGASLSVNYPRDLPPWTKVTGEGLAQTAIQEDQLYDLFRLVEQAAPGATSGPGGKLLLKGNRLVKMVMGPDFAGDTIADDELLNSLQQRLAGLQRIPGSGQQSDFEFKTYLDAVPGLSTSREGNLFLAAVGKKLIERHRKDFDAWKAYAETNMSDVGFQKDPTPVLTDEEFSALATGKVPGEPAAQGVPPGGGTPGTQPPPPPNAKSGDSYVGSDGRIYQVP